MPPRASLRAREATPARSNRATSTARQETPATRRSTRAASKQPITTKDVVSNPALPEIQTQQSYAYGSSKTPVLPEQLHARSLNMSALAAHLDDATNEAERNLQAHAAELRGSTPESQSAAREERAQRRASKQPAQRSSQSPTTETPGQVRKQNRVAAWVQSSSQLDDISEENSRQQSSPRQSLERDREESLPSSFPDGSFDHSYSYERGERGPKLPRARNFSSAPHARPDPKTQHATAPPARLRSEPGAYRPSRASLLLKKTNSQLKDVSTATLSFFNRSASSITEYLQRILQTMRRSLLELPDTVMILVMFKTIITTAVLSLLGLLFCLVFTQICNPTSSSIISQSLQSLCGSCSPTSSLPSWNITDPGDMQQLLSALKQTQTQIAQVESRLNSRITLNHASLASDASALRSHQEALETQIRRLTKNQLSTDASSSNEVTSPLMPRINFFSPANGAVVIPQLTSPTLAEEFFFPFAVALRALRMRKLLSPPPVTALENWLDEADCWCAAPTEQATNVVENIEQDSIRLAIQTSQYVYPTELVIEHFPASGSLEPGTAPKDIELWADFSSLTYDDWSRLHIQDLIDESPNQAFVPSQPGVRNTWARIGIATYHISTAQDSETETDTYELKADESYSKNMRTSRKVDARGQVDGPHHVQKFNLLVNQHGSLHYSNRYMLRVRSNYGADHTCLYRVRLHGQKLDMKE